MVRIRHLNPKRLRPPSAAVRNTEDWDGDLILDFPNNLYDIVSIDPPPPPCNCAALTAVSLYSFLTQINFYRLRLRKEGLLSASPTLENDYYDSQEVDRQALEDAEHVSVRNELWLEIIFSI